ncbi:hypothetical protein PsorP6_001762 [Peronosclerospora sorghi]|uniref:Uncharacterized protein n=1 Tax=Peronosclerospora sorghi TaxID=230839 RepID=A0ACC0WVV4_9STRA|nr:hypothetical protein PsorP6_001762 [Peronosclerospora sorghi]
MRMSYRGEQAESTCIVLQNELHADLTISGWVMSLTLLQVFCEIMDVFSVLWVADTETSDSRVGRTRAPESISTSAWMEVPEFGIQIRAPILEAYLDDSHCVAKLTIEDSSNSYYADPGVENFKLHLGPTELIILTEDVALRLVQVGNSGLVIIFDCTDRQDGSSVDLEADRRLELLFALVEALKYDCTSNDAKEEAEDDSASEEKFAGTASSQENVYLRHRGRRGVNQSQTRRCVSKESSRVFLPPPIGGIPDARLPNAHIHPRGNMSKVAKIYFEYLLEHDREILLELSW